MNTTGRTRGLYLPSAKFIASRLFKERVIIALKADFVKRRI
jgi:hypothetical protein